MLYTLCLASSQPYYVGVKGKQSKTLYNNKLVYTVFLTVYGVIIITNGVMETQLDSDSSSTDTIKNTLIDISNEDTSVIKGYAYISSLDSQTPKNFFKSGVVGFDILLNPPTENTDWWSVGVFATRKAMDMLYLACHSYDSSTYNAIADMSTNTDRMFNGSEDNLRIETGFLSQLTTQSRRNYKYGFAHKTTVIPHSQEMMVRVVNGVNYTLSNSLFEATKLLEYKKRSGIVSLSAGGLSLD